MRRATLVFIWITFLLGISSFGAAASLPDYYQESGFSPNREYEVSQAVESVDPFGGGLQRTIVDLVAPGNAGLDIVVRRFYRAPAGNPNLAGGLGKYLGVRSAVGQGWDIHFGRVWHGNTFSGSGTACGTKKDASGQNPILELADGTRQELLDDTVNTRYITKNFWIGICENGGLTVVSPRGMRYTFDYFKPFLVTGDSNPADAWHVTKIADKFGNFLTVEYVTGTTSQALVSEVSSSDGRSVTFHYTNQSAATVRLSEIRLNNAWRASYTYSAMSGSQLETRYYLETASRRDEGGDWEYDYYTSNPSSNYGLYALEEVRAPTGLVTNYTYDGVQFAFNRWTTVLATKSVAGAGVNEGVWSYEYSPSTASRNYDITTVKSENYCTIYEHRGASLANSGEFWLIGTLEETRLYNQDTCSSTSLVQTEQYVWSNVFVSSQNERNREPLWPGEDLNSVKAVVGTKRITRDGALYTTVFSNFDEYGNARTISENGPNSNDDRLTTLTYQNFDDEATWVLGLVDLKTISGEGSINHNYYTTGVRRGSLQNVSEFGRTAKQFNYYTTGANRGEYSSIVDEEGNTTSYSNYYRGIPETENHPEGVTILRNVNATGTVQWQEDGKGNRTSYTYDNFNRLKSITTPRTDDSNVTINWSSGGRVRSVIRSTFTSTHTADGNGNTLEVNAEGIRKKFTYNEEGHLSFESFSSTATNPSTGTTYTSDVLGRPIRVLHEDGTDVDYDYDISTDNAVSVANERNLLTQYRYVSYGDPDERYLIQILSPESITTTINRDKLGNIESVTQGGVTRTFNLDSRKFLDSEIHPETGTTDVAVDDLGSMTSRKVGTSGVTTYTYDSLNRLDFVNYPGTTSDVDYEYDDNSNVTDAFNGLANWKYGYDENNNLETETATVLGRTYEFVYNYDNKDNLSSISYPNNLSVQYAPDDLGRPTSVGTFATLVEHHPNGQLKTIRYGNGRQTTFTQDARQRIDVISAPGVINLDYGYDGVGNTLSIVDGISPSNTISMTYDDVGRLETASGPFGAANFGYSSDGDLDFKNVGGFNLNHNYSATTNRLTSITGSRAFSFSYDVYGNVTNNGTDTFVYNDAAQLVSVPSDSISYSYDANNRRVVKYVNGAPAQVSLYNKAGLLMFESDQFNDFQTAYIYAGAQLIARQEFCNNGDADNDGLGSCFEIPLGLNTSLADSDGNGIDDGDEDSDGDGINNEYEYLNGLNPKLNDAALDSDNDGLTNLQEFQLGTLSNSSDTDSDGLPDNWEFNNGTNAIIADANADLDGDRLTNIQEYNLGLNAGVQDTDADGIRDDNEDNDADGLSNYAEYQNATNPLNPDSDGDAMNDGYEVLNGLNPLLNDAALDPDADLLDNLTEMQLGTDPHDADTDNDGVSDGDEVAQGTDPLFNFAAILPAILHVILN